MARSSVYVYSKPYQYCIPYQILDASVSSKARHSTHVNVRISDMSSRTALRPRTPSAACLSPAVKSIGCSSPVLTSTAASTEQLPSKTPGRRGRAKKRLHLCVGDVNSSEFQGLVNINSNIIKCRSCCFILKRYTYLTRSSYTLRDAHAGTMRG